MYASYKVAILIDAGFFKTRYKAKYKRPPQIQDIPAFIDGLMQKVQQQTGNIGKDILHRIYYYDCRPYGDVQTRPDGTRIDFSKTTIFQSCNSLHLHLRTYPQLSLRLGELSFDGWKVDPKKVNGPLLPDFKQKSVDMKIGLDIAWMAYRHTVDKLVLVAADSDFTEPMKIARKEGLQVYLETLGQKQVKISLKEQADFIL
jgi:uncharacterized LabA/DUF88 family protein